MKILLLDIETAPITAYIWRLNQKYVNPSHIVDTSYIMCWAAKWVGEDAIFFDSMYHNNMKNMLKGIHELLNEADAVVHYNGSKFDIPVLNREFLLHGYKPPSPYKQIDLLKVARNQFKFPSNRLDYVSSALGLGGKTKHSGMDLWKNCMDYKASAWKTMEEYNTNDVILLEKVYDKFLPWIKNHVNLSVLSGELMCPNCSSRKYQKRGFSYTQAAKYQRYQCSSCGNWFRGGKSLAKGVEGKFANV